MQVLGVTLARNSRCFKMLDEAKSPRDKKAAEKCVKRLVEFGLKAEACNYELSAISKLREEYKDVL